MDRQRIRNNTRIETILFIHKWRVKETGFDRFENKQIPGIEIRLTDEGLQFLDRGNLFFYAHEIDSIERTLKFVSSEWRSKSRKGNEIPFSEYLAAASGKVALAA